MLVEQNDTVKATDRKYALLLTDLWTIIGK